MYHHNHVRTVPRACVLLAVALTSSVIPPCRAASILVPFHSFEGESTYESPSTTGWTTNSGKAAFYNPYEIIGGNGFYVGANPGTEPGPGGMGTGYPGIDGSRLAFVYQGEAGSGFTEQLDATFMAGMSYQLTVAEGRRNGYYGAPTLGSLIELLAGDTVVAWSRDDMGPAPGQFEDQVAYLADSTRFSSLVGQRLSIRILTTLAPTVANQATDWDNVRLEATSLAPEPGTTILLVCGMLVSIGACGVRIRGRATKTS